jgi:hypothetical protein
MMAVVKYDVVAKNGTYKDRNGDEKTRWLKMGVCFESEKGLSIKIDSMPIAFDGWMSLMTPKPKEGAPSTANSIDDDIPF